MRRGGHPGAVPHQRRSTDERRAYGYQVERLGSHAGFAEAALDQWVEGKILLESGVRIALVFALAAATGAAAAAPREPLEAARLYAERHVFDILRDGKPVGRHEVAFSTEEDRLAVQVRMEIAIPFLFFTAYRYRYRSDSLWREGRLLRLSADTDDNGEKSTVRAEQSGETLAIEGPRGREVVDGFLLPTDHWHPAVIGRDRVLNTITGEVNAASIVAEGVDRLPTPQGVVEATRYRYSGDLENVVWYDAVGRWVGMRFSARDGSTIEYVCRTCPPTFDGSDG